MEVHWLSFLIKLNIVSFKLKLSKKLVLELSLSDHIQNWPNRILMPINIISWECNFFIIKLFVLYECNLLKHFDPLLGFDVVLCPGFAFPACPPEYCSRLLTGMTKHFLILMQHKKKVILTYNNRKRQEFYNFLFSNGTKKLFVWFSTLFFLPVPHKKKHR